MLVEINIDYEIKLTNEKQKALTIMDLFKKNQCREAFLYSDARVVFRTLQSI